MNRPLATLAAVAASAAGTLALAHTFEHALSHAAAPQVLDRAICITAGPLQGVPNTRASQAAFHHHDALALEDGAFFVAVDDAGASEQIVFTAADFVGTMGGHIGNAHIHDVVDVINAKATLFTASFESDAVVFRSHEGGSSARFDLIDGFGTPLEKLALQTGPGFGDDDLVLHLETPSVEPANLAGQTYWLVVSATPGTVQFEGSTVPIGVDALTGIALNAAFTGALPGWVGQLDAQGRALVSTDTALFAGLPAGFELYLAYVVPHPFWPTLPGADLVSNRLTLALE